MGEHINVGAFGEPSGFYSYFAVHSLKDGILDRVEITEEGKKHILESHLVKKSGDGIKAFTGANTTLGCIVMKFDSFEQMIHMMDNSEKWCKVILKE